MEIKETFIKTLEQPRAIENEAYFKYIFKKTEKIACAVFYILRSGDVSQNDHVVIDLEDAASDVLDVALESLKGTEANLRDKIIDLRFTLLSLESRLRVAHAAHHIGGDLLQVFIHEIESLYRSMKRYTDQGSANPLAGDVEEVRKVEYRQSRPRPVRTADTSMNGEITNPSSGTDMSRRDRVIEVLKSRPWATIKDISEVITDCSEKTIQRELISMIKDNIIVRQGDRRWSKYNLV